MLQYCWLDVLHSQLPLGAVKARVLPVKDRRKASKE